MQAGTTIRALSFLVHSMRMPFQCSCRFVADFRGYNNNSRVTDETLQERRVYPLFNAIFIESMGSGIRRGVAYSGLSRSKKINIEKTRSSPRPFLSTYSSPPVSLPFFPFFTFPVPSLFPNDLGVRPRSFGACPLNSKRRGVAPEVSYRGGRVAEIKNVGGWNHPLKSFRIDKGRERATRERFSRARAARAAKNVIGFNWIGDCERTPLFIFGSYGAESARARNGRRSLECGPRAARFSLLSGSSTFDFFFFAQKPWILIRIGDFNGSSYAVTRDTSCPSVVDF